MLECCLQILEKAATRGGGRRDHLDSMEYLTGNIVRMKLVTQDLVQGLDDIAEKFQLDKNKK